MRYEYVKRFIGFICSLAILSACTTSKPENFQDAPSSEPNNHAEEEKQISEPNNHAEEEGQKRISLGGSHYKIGNSVYFFSMIFSGGGGTSLEIKNADVDTFQVLKDYYSKDKSFVYHREKIIEEANSDSFEALTASYAKDNNYVYWYGHIIENADFGTFEVITSRRRSILAKDKYAVYSKGERIEGADPSTYAIFFEGNLTFAKDKYAVYTEFGDLKINEADPDTFEVIHSDDYFDFAKDENYVFLAGIPGRSSIAIINDADSGSFEILDYYYAKDNNYVYWHGDTMEEADSATFEVLGYDLAKDKNHVYYEDRIIDVADPDTFEVIYLDDYLEFAKDKNYVFFVFVGIGRSAVLYTINDADPGSFKILGYHYAKDKSFVYYRGRVVDVADPDTFQLLDHIYAKDKNYVYKYGKIVEGEDPETFKP